MKENQVLDMKTALRKYEQNKTKGDNVNTTVVPCTIVVCYCCLWGGVGLEQIILLCRDEMHALVQFAFPTAPMKICIAVVIHIMLSIVLKGLSQSVHSFVSVMLPGKRPSLRSV